MEVYTAMTQEINFKDQEALNTLVSDEFGDWSNAVTITQDMINQFAELSGDHMWLHVDEEKCAKESPFGSTIAHGFLILSMLSRFQSAPSGLQNVSGFGHMMNYGSDKLRFLGVVPVNSEIHTRSRIKEVEVNERKTKIVMETHLHVVGQDKPALIYEMMFVYL